MTPQEREQVERELILDILLESTKWHIDNDADDAIRLEVGLRARRLLGIEGISNSEPQSVIERGLARQKAKSGQSHGQLRPGYHRVSVDGHKLTLHESQLDKIPWVSSPTGYRWIPKPGVVKGVDNGKTES
jgi:hypothetical protein